MYINYLNSSAEEICLFSLSNYHSPQVTLAIKTLPANEGDARDVGSILVSGRSPGE